MITKPIRLKFDYLFLKDQLQLEEMQNVLKFARESLHQLSFFGNIGHIKQGHIGVVQALEAQTQYHQARLTQIEALADYAIAEARLSKATPQGQER